MLTLFKNVQIATGDALSSGSILVENERIIKVFAQPACPVALPAGCTVVEGTGLIAMPGLIDDQVHFREPGQEEKGTLASESRAALLGGVTTYLDMPNNRPPAVTGQAVHDKYRRAERESYANYGFYIGATNQNAAEVLQTAPPCCGVKVFMGSSTGNMLVDNPQTLATLFERYKGVLATHCEEESIIKANTAQAVARYGTQIPARLHSTIRSRQACIASTAKALDLAVAHRTHLHVLHLTTRQEVDLIAQAKKSNPLISAEVCVHHLWFSQQDYKRYGHLIKCNPAIKDAADRQALRYGVIDGVIDVIGSDHAPHTRQEKASPYLQAPGGIPLVQHTLMMLLELVDKGIFTLPQVVRCCCTTPARLFNIAQRGRLEAGAFADIVLVQPHSPFTVTAQNIAYKCGWSPLEGHTFPWRIGAVYVNGCRAVVQGQLTARPPVYPI